MFQRERNAQLNWGEGDSCFFAVYNRRTAQEANDIMHHKWPKSNVTSISRQTMSVYGRGSCEYGEGVWEEELEGERGEGVIGGKGGGVVS